MYVVEDKVVFIHVKPGKLGLYIHLFILGIVFDFFFCVTFRIFFRVSFINFLALAVGKASWSGGSTSCWSQSSLAPAFF